MSINKTTILYDEIPCRETVPSRFPAARIRSVQWDKDIPLLKDTDDTSTNETADEEGAGGGTSAPKADPDRHN